MNRGAILTAFQKQGCQAYQAELAADFLEDASAPHHLLLTPAGLGKVLIAARIVKFMTVHCRTRRVLVVAPSAFCMLWRSRLEGQSLPMPVKLMYGRDFRQATATAGSPSTEEAVAIVPCDTAVSSDVRRALAATSWDLVILAEVQRRSRCQPLGLYQEMLAANALKRSLLISDATIEYPEGQTCDAFPDFQVTNWFGQLPDWDGQMIELPPVRWRVLEYTRSNDEIHFQQLVQQQLKQTHSTHSPFYFQTGLLDRRAASSPYAAERTLEIMGRKLTRAPLSRLGMVPEKEYGDPTEVEDVPNLSFSPETRQSYLHFVRDAFGAFQRISTDAKLDCLLSLLDDLADERPGRICVLCACADTVTYLHDALAGEGIPAAVVNGGLRYTERQQAMKDFVRNGGILLATPGALGEESDLNQVKHVIHYDLPANRSQMAQLKGRFGKINRTDACRMYALEDLSEIGPGPETIANLTGEPQGAA